MANNVINMCEKDIVNDCLASQKYLTSSYNSFAGECVNQNLRDDFLNILKDEHQIQAELFSEMQSHGWYTVEPAEQQKINQARQQYANG